jgi:hypothetical protein
MYRLSKRFICLAAAGCLCLCACHKSPHQPSTGSGIKITTQKINLGTIPHNKPTHYTIKYRNTGNTSISIVDIESSCTCTTFRWNKASIASGRKGTITLTYTPKYYGHFKESIRIFTSASEDSVVKVSLKGRVTGS